MNARSHTVSATPQMEAIYKDVAAHLQTVCAKNPNLRSIDIIAILGRMQGYALATCFPNERDLARQTAIMNMDIACEEVAQIDGPQGPVGRA